MRHTGDCARIAWAGALLGLLMSAGGCEGTGRIGGLGSGPEQEVWAIRCATLQGPDRFRRANAFAEALKKVPGLKPELVQVVGDEDGATLFYGRYRRVYGTDDPAQRYEPNHLRDLELLRALRFQGDEVWPFILATMDVLPTFRSQRPEWDLNKVDGYWALHVAVFYNTEGFRSRRSAAEEYCRLLREQGEEAYFHHGSQKSSVYVGTYLFGAVSEVRREDPLSGRVSTTMSIVDSRMQEAQQRFPISLHNGHKMFDVMRDPRTGEVRERVPAPSFPVIIPRAQRPPGTPGQP